jgi:ribosomal protein L3 glutamine methyltransferase
MTSSDHYVFPELNTLKSFTTIADWIRLCASEMERSGCFYGHGFADPLSEAQFLVLRSISLDWDTPISYFSAQLMENEQEKLFKAIQQRCVAKMPSAYLLEEAWFFNEPFRVTPDVLIPRSPIAELIEAGFEPWVEDTPQHMLDLCTGSGCIGIAMARRFPETKIDVSDLSDAAVGVAIENVSAKDLGFQVDVFQGDLFESLTGAQYDVIVSNPPYVDLEDIDDMPAEFQHEPRMGLTAGDDGLDIVRKILAQAPNYLTERGWLFCEVGNSAVTLMDTFPEVPFQWPEFEQGGHGVFVISAEELKKHHSLFL